MSSYSSFKKIENEIYLNKIEPVGATVEHFEQYLDEALIFLNSIESKSILIVDLTTAKMLTANLKSKLGYFYRDHRDMIKEKVLGAVYIAPSPVIQITLKNAFFIGSPPMEYKIVSNMELAMIWAKRKLILEKTS